MTSIICINNAETRKRLNPSKRLRKRRPPLVRHAPNSAGIPLCGKWRYKKTRVFQTDLDEPNCPLCLLALEALAK